MNFKKIISLSVAVLSVAAALIACSDDKVSGADIQDNSMAQNSNNGLSDQTIVLLTRLKNHSPNIPVAFVSNGSSVVEDSVNVHETYKEYVNLILNKNSYEWDNDGKLANTYDENGDLILSFFSGGLRDENGKLYGPVHMFELTPEYRKANCGFPGPLVYSDEVHSIHSGSEVFETRIDKERYDFQSDEMEWVVKNGFFSYDSSLIQQFKEDCLVENGQFAHNPYTTISVSEDDSVLYVHHDSIYTCQTLVPSVGDGTSYTNSFWKKYVSLIFDRCVADYDSLAYYFPDDLDESEP